MQIKRQDYCPGYYSAVFLKTYLFKSLTLSCIMSHLTTSNELNDSDLCSFSKCIFIMYIKKYSMMFYVKIVKL